MEDMILDQSIDDSTIKIWTCFSDKKINQILEKVFAQNKYAKIDEEEDTPLNGKAWQDLPFWGKVKDWIVPGKNIDGTHKGWFEDRKFPTKIIKAADLTPDVLLKTLDDGFNIKVDYNDATPEQKKEASQLLSKAFDREFLKAHAQAAVDASDAAGIATGIAGGIYGGPIGAAAGATAAKGAVLKADEKLVIDKFNDSVKGTKYEKLQITKEDMGYKWLDHLVDFVITHPYASLATVVSIVAAWKGRNWLWSRLKLGFSKLWQGTIIAKYQFDLVNGEKLSFEYDLRTNKWKLLNRDFKWTGQPMPSKQMLMSFTKTEHCKKFIETCKKYMDKWFSNEDQIRNIVSMNNDKDFIRPAEMILAVLDDKEDIESSFIQLKY